MATYSQGGAAQDILADRFPENGDKGIPADLANPAIRLYG